MMTNELPPLLPTRTRSGKIPASASKITSTVRNVVMPRMEEAAGIWALNTVPGGALISSERNMPVVLGICSRIIEWTHKATYEVIIDSVLLRVLRTCGLEPVKSAVSESPSSVSLQQILTGFENGRPVRSATETETLRSLAAWLGR